MDALTNGALTVNEEIRGTEVASGFIGGVVVAVVITEGVKAREGNEVKSVAAEVKVEFAAVVLESPIVTLAKDTLVDVGFVVFRNGGPGVEREVVEKTLSGNGVLEGTGLVAVVAWNSVVNL